METISSQLTWEKKLSQTRVHLMLFARVYAVLTVTAFCQLLVNNEQCTNNLFQLVMSLATECVRQKIYLKRAEILATLYTQAQLKSGALQMHILYDKKRR